MGIQNHSDRSLIKKKVKMIKVSAPVEKSTRNSRPAFSTRLFRNRKLSAGPNRARAENAREGEPGARTRRASDAIDPDLIPGSGSGSIPALPTNLRLRLYNAFICAAHMILSTRFLFHTVAPVAPPNGSLITLTFYR